MQIRQLVSGLSLAAALSLCSGCASIVSGRKAEVAFTSNPPGAQVIVENQRGHTVATVNTPGVVSLRRNRPYFIPARYTATFVAPGYEPARVPLRSTVNPWILGNVIVGGIPGLVVDNATGAAWKPRCDEVYQNLVPSAVPPASTATAELPGNEFGLDDMSSIAQNPTDAAKQR